MTLKCLQIAEVGEDMSSYGRVSIWLLNRYRKKWYGARHMVSYKSGHIAFNAWARFAYADCSSRV